MGRGHVHQEDGLPAQLQEEHLHGFEDLVRFLNYFARVCLSSSCRESKKAARNFTPPGTTNVEFWYDSNNYVEQTHYYAYGIRDLVADIGGYLGLLLGHSVLNFYDGARALCCRAKSYLFK